MKVRNAIRDYQRRLAELDTEHSRAKDRLAAARAKRAKVVEEQDQLVAAAEQDVEVAITAMALEAGPELAASLLEVDVARVRRLAKERRSSAARPIPDVAKQKGLSSGG